MSVKVSNGMADGSGQLPSFIQVRGGQKITQVSVATYLGGRY
jgi:hypothetical protein